MPLFSILRYTFYINLNTNSLLNIHTMIDNSLKKPEDISQEEFDLIKNQFFLRRL